MALLLSPEIYKRLEEKFGEKEAEEIVNVLGVSLQGVEKKAEETFAKIRDKADFLITQKKFELKDELTKELVTKADLALVKADLVELKAELKADIARIEFKLDRKFTLMFYILLFAIIFLNQNALRFIAELFGLIKP